MTKLLRLTTFGKLQITQDDVPLTGFVSSKAEALLCYLAITNRSHYRTTLAGLLWGEMPESEARANLRVVLSNLRRLVGPHLTITRQTVTFNRDVPYWLDVEHFLVAQNAPGAEPTPLQEAVELYQGDFLEGFYVRDAPAFEEWVLTERERLRELVLQTLHTLSSLFATKGIAGRAAAIDYTGQLLALDPWREEAHRQLMLLLARSGQRSAALAQYKSCRRVLADELGVEPLPETTALYNRIRTAISGGRHNLPAQATPFLGRETELAELSQSLADPACRLLTLVGPGGIGKTRLALQTANEHSGTGYFLDGLYYVSLAPLESPDFLVSTIADALDFSFYRDEDPKVQLLNYLREREILLVLDNFEHLLAGVDLLAQILKEAAGIKLLVTSQQRLNLRGEWVIKVPGLDVPQVDPPKLQSAAAITPSNLDEEGAIEALEDYSAIQLFLQSANRVQAGFSLPAAERPFVVRICQLVAGIPLGIELAAAWVRVLSCREIAQETERSLDFLSALQRDLPKRQQSLRAVFEYSWRLLSEPERNVFKQLAVFRGSFRRAGANKVAGANLSQLSALVDKSFLRWSNPSQGGATGRYEMQETLWLYALEKLQAEVLTMTQAQDRHCEYFTTFLYRRETMLQGEQQSEALAEIRTEIDNIRAAWQWAITFKKNALIGKSANTLFLFYEIQSWYQEGEAAFELAVAGLTEEQEENEKPLAFVLGQVLARQGAFCRRLSQYEKAETLLRKGLEILRGVGQRAEEAFALNQLGNVAGARGEYKQAKRFYEESLALKREFGDQHGIAVSQNNLGYVAYLLGHYADARGRFEESLGLCRKIGDRWGLALTLNNLGLVVNALGEYREAKTLFQQSLSICREIGDQFVMTLALNNLGLVAEAMGEFVEAKQQYEASLAIGQETGNRRITALALNNLGGVAGQLQDYTLAKQRYEESLVLRREIGDQLGLVYTLNGLGQVAGTLNKFPEAKKHFSEALTIATAIQALPATLDVLVAVGGLSMKEGQKERAAELLALVFHHPAAKKEVKDRAAAYLTALAAELSPEELNAARSKGQTAQLDLVVAEISVATSNGEWRVASDA